MAERKPLERLEPGLPGAWYSDPAHYERELEAFWYAKWIAVAREEEIAAPGDWRLVKVGTQSILLVRNEGELRAFQLRVGVAGTEWPDGGFLGQRKA